tara:strand:+ start:69 stop:851 length:783 start_codon:yes stop_codon:yes gene_type:complete
MKLKDQISIIQNFTIFPNNKERLDLITSEVGLKSTAKVLKDCNFYVNYKTTTFLEEIESVYSKNIKNLFLYNNLEDSDFYWPAVELQLILQSDTPYVMLVSEDRMFNNTTHKEFQSIMDDMIRHNVSYMPIGKLFVYTSGSKHKNIMDVPSISSSYKEGGEHLWLYKAKNSPGKSFSIDAIYKRELIIEKLEEIIHQYGKEMSPNAKFPKNMPHYFEDYYTDSFGNGVKKCGNMMCAVPKKEIVVSDETPGFIRLKSKQN